MKRVVITGIGFISGLGTNGETLGQTLRDGQSAIGCQVFELPSGKRSLLSGAIHDFSVTAYLKSRKAYLDRTSELTLAATALTLADAGLDSEHDVGDIGWLFGTMYGNMATSVLYYGDIMDKGPQSAKPVLFPHLYANSAASLTAIEFNLGGMHAVYAGGWTAGAEAVLQAADWIGTGRAHTLLAGGADALHPLTVRGLHAEKRLSPLAGSAGGEQGVYSFDRRANGIVLGEGAAILALESASHAVARGATIRAELAGGARGSVGSAHDAATIMRRALERSESSVRELSWVCAHGAGDPCLDDWEGDALEVMARERETPLTIWTPAPLLGETLAAGTGLRMALALGIMQDRRLPALPGNLTCNPNLNRIDFSSQARRVEEGPILINTFCPGGNLVAMVIKPRKSTDGGGHHATGSAESVNSDGYSGC